MLVFTRKRHEAIMIGDGVEVRVLRVGKDGVRLGIVAPNEVRVHRREVYDQIRDANQSAVVSPDQVAQVAGDRRRRSSSIRGLQSTVLRPSTSISRRVHFERWKVNSMAPSFQLRPPSLDESSR